MPAMFDVAAQASRLRGYIASARFQDAVPENGAEVLERLDKACVDWIEYCTVGGDAPAKQFMEER